MTRQMNRLDQRFRAWTTFLRAHATVVGALESELQAQQELPLTDYDVLVQLSTAEDGRLRMSDLADRLLISRSGATRLVDRLVAGGLVERVSCESDRRGQWASLTDAGRRRLRDASPTHLRGIEEHFLGRFEPGELESLASLLDRLVSDPQR